jgi:hypothetical protein
MRSIERMTATFSSIDSMHEYKLNHEFCAIFDSLPASVPDLDQRHACPAFVQTWNYERPTKVVRVAAGNVGQGATDVAVALEKCNLSTRLSRNQADGAQTNVAMKSVRSNNRSLWQEMARMIAGSHDISPEMSATLARRVRVELLNAPVRSIFPNRMIASVLPFFTDHSTQLDFSNVSALGAAAAFWLNAEVDFMNKKYAPPPPSPCPSPSGTNGRLAMRIMPNGQWRIMAMAA